MKAINTEKVAVRFNISVQANEKIELLQATQRLNGKKMTKEEVVDYMILNFKESNNSNS